MAEHDPLGQAVGNGIGGLLGELVTGEATVGEALCLERQLGDGGIMLGRLQAAQTFLSAIPYV